MEQLKIKELVNILNIDKRNPLGFKEAFYLLLDLYNISHAEEASNRRRTRIPDETLRGSLEEAVYWQIISVVLRETGLTVEMVFSKSRKREIVMARQMIIYFLTINPNNVFSAIGGVFHKNHATVMHSRNTIENLIDIYPDLKLKILKLARLIVAEKQV
jgi:chromosomal replication initiator protein